jgi:hypothetical protein
MNFRYVTMQHRAAPAYREPLFRNLIVSAVYIAALTIFSAFKGALLVDIAQVMVSKAAAACKG